MSRVVVIGGGAAGMMAAVAAAELGHDTTLLEKNEKLGKKVYITGKGRCNVTNACDTEQYFNHVFGNSKFLYSAVYQYDARAVMEFIENQGCPLKVERGQRVFPVSDHSSDIIKAFQKALQDNYVKVKLYSEVKKILMQDEHVTGVELKKGGKIEADAVIVATGGLSYATTGSTGDGYLFAKAAGHEVTPTYPALVPLTIKEVDCKELQGLSLRNVKASLSYKGKNLYEDFGEMLFTHFGVSGPLMLSASSIYSAKCYGEEAALSIDLKPALTTEQLDKRILREIEENGAKNMRNILPSLFPHKLIPVMCKRCGIEETMRGFDLTKEKRQKLVEETKNFCFTVTGTRDFIEAIITHGGVSLKEINPSTMESKLVKGLYFAGEVLDLDAVTGGFNLQIAWSTGHLAGSSIEWV